MTSFCGKVAMILWCHCEKVAKLFRCHCDYVVIILRHHWPKLLYYHDNILWQSCHDIVTSLANVVWISWCHCDKGVMTEWINCDKWYYDNFVTKLLWYYDVNVTKLPTFCVIVCLLKQMAKWFKFKCFEMLNGINTHGE